MCRPLRRSGGQDRALALKRSLKEQTDAERINEKIKGGQKVTKSARPQGSMSGEQSMRTQVRAERGEAGNVCALAVCLADGVSSL